MEPPLYGQLSKASREMDMSKIDTLGPFARALLEVLGGGNNVDKKREDALKRGKENGSKGPLGHFSQSFVVFRGVKMVDDELFDYYKNKLGRSVNVSGTTSTSSELSVALEQSKCGKTFKNQPGKSVLFVFLLRNYSFQFFFRVNKPEYSPYPHE